MERWQPTSGSGGCPKPNAEALAHSSEESLSPFWVGVICQGPFPGLGTQRGCNGCLQDGPEGVVRGGSDGCDRGLQPAELACQDRCHALRGGDQLGVLAGRLPCEGVGQACQLAGVCR